MLTKVFFKEGWTLKLFAVTKSINSGTTNGVRTNGERMDLAQKIRIFDVIILFIYLHCDVNRQLLVQTDLFTFCYESNLCQ